MGTKHLLMNRALLGSQQTVGMLQYALARKFRACHMEEEMDTPAGKREYPYGHCWVTLDYGSVPVSLTPEAVGNFISCFFLSVQTKHLLIFPE